MIENQAARNDDVELGQDLAALARLVTYARQTSQGMNMGFPTYCLDLALAALLEEMQDLGIDTTAAMAEDRPVIVVGLH